MTIHRRVIAIALLALLVTACGSSASPDTASPADAASASSGATEPAAGAFPVTIEHKFGTTEIAEEPQRVLALGYQEHDAILALGVEPIAVRYWFGDETDVIFPWAEDEAGDADPEILNMTHGELNYEAITALRLDLILGIYSGITADEYETLSQIAPTVAQTDDYVDFGVPWQEMTRTVGRALGREDHAQDLVAEVEAEFAAVRDAHPEFAGRSVVVATYGTDEIGFFASEDPRSRFFTSLGFEVAAELDELAGDSFYGTLSPERTDLLERDLLVWDQMAYVDGGRPTIEADPLVAGLAVMTDQRAVYLEGDVEDAFAFSSVLSLPFALDEITPLIAAASRS